MSRRHPGSTTASPSWGIRVTDVRVAAGSQQQERTGLLGWVSFVLNDSLHVDGVTLRRTVEDEIVLSFPARRDAAGRQYFYLRPLSDEVRRDIEHQVFAAIGLPGSQGS